MTDVNISQQDLLDAETFLAEYMTEKVPEANFAKGSAMRDLAVRAFAYLYAYLRGEIDRVTARQSLVRIQEELTDADDIAQAVDELLSNWFMVRKGGTEARLTARMHFTERRSVSLPLSSQFWRTSTLVFYIDGSVDPFVISEDQLLPVYDSRGVLVDYVAEVPLKAAEPGVQYLVEPGTFYRVLQSGGLQYLSFVDHAEKASGGKDVESSDALIARTDTAITVRNLINNRSCDTTLQGLFPEITDTLTIGMGESEMVRDRRLDFFPTMELHIGGHYDTYLDLPLVQVDENLQVGGYFARPDGIVNLFRDPYLTYDLATTFTALGVQPGHVLYIRSGIVGVPRGFPITRVTDHELEVSLYSPFAEASDELGVTVNYSIGWLAPGFEEIDFGAGVYTRDALASLLPGTLDIPVGTSRHTQAAGRVVLSGRPIQNLLTVEVTDPVTGDVLVDPGSGTVVFRTRVNGAPDNVTAATTGTPTLTQYQWEVANPERAQSSLAVNTINVGTASGPYTGYEGKNLHVSYLTLSGFSNVVGYASARDQRVLAANHLLRARNPVWISMLVEYRLRPTSDAVFDTTLAAQELADYINAFDTNDDLDASDIMTFLRSQYPVLGAVYPFTSSNPLSYQLYAPDGQIVQFETTDVVSIFEEYGVTLVNAAAITMPAELQRRGITTITSATDLRDWFLYLGVSNRTVKYRTLASLITFVLKE